VSMPGISKAVAARVREAAGNRCGYCLAAQQYVLHVLEIEHVVPTAVGVPRWKL
jgi:hypothetical protein